VARDCRTTEAACKAHSRPGAAHCGTTYSGTDRGQVLRGRGRMQNGFSRQWSWTGTSYRGRGLAKNGEGISLECNELSQAGKHPTSLVAEAPQFGARRKDRLPARLGAHSATARLTESNLLAGGWHRRRAPHRIHSPHLSRTPPRPRASSPCAPARTSPAARRSPGQRRGRTRNS